MRTSRLVAIAGLLGLLAGTAGAQPFFAAGNTTSRRYDHTATLLPNGKVLIAGGYSNTSDLETAELYDPATGTFTATGSMSIKRYRHTATLLRNGKVLIAGGGSVVQPTIASAELYDPATGAFTVLGSEMTVARYRQTATLLMDGRVLLTAGFDDFDGALDSSEIFDPATSTFSPGPQLASGLRIFHTATLLPDGMVLVAGGYSDGFLSSAELYDPVANDFTALASGLGTARYYHTATLLPNGTVLIAGGTNSSGNLTSAEIYTHAVGGGTFAPATGNLITAREYHSAALLPNGKVLVTSGWSGSNAIQSCELYDPTAGTFSNAGTLSERRENHTSTVLPGGNVLLVGGSNGVQLLNTTVLYDPNDAAASAGPAPGSARTNHTATPLPDGRVLLAGGTSGGPLASAELFDPTAPGFSATTGPMSAPRSGHTATLLPGGNVLVAGGGSADLFAPATGTFAPTAGAMTASRSGHTATLLTTGKVLLAGGLSGTPLASAEIYDPGTNAFTAVPLPMGSARSGHTATLLPNGFVLLAGGTGAGGALSSAELYDPVANAFSAVASPMTAARTAHTATLLPSGRVFLAGGSSGSAALNTAELFDAATGLFTAHNRTLGTARSGHTATLLTGGEVLLAGGTGASPLTSLEVFTPATGRFATTATSLATGRSGHRGTLLIDGRVLVSGGAATATSDLVNPGLGVEVRRPVLTAAPSAIGQPGSVTLGGTGFLGDSEGGSGSCLSSSTSVPVVRLQRIEGEQVVYALPDPAQPSTSTAFASAPLAIAGGHYRITLFTLGLSSWERATDVTPACATPPSPPVPGNNGPICAGSDLILSASTVPGATYLWTGPSGFSSALQNPVIVGATPAASGTYSVTAIVGGCASVPASTTAVVNPIPAAPTAANNGPVCAGTVLNLTASTVPGAAYSWTGPNGFTSTLQNPSISSPSAASAGTYSVTVTVNGCVSTPATTNAVVNPSPGAPIASNGGPVCAGQTLTLAASSIAGATYAWTGPGGFTSSLQNPVIVQASVAASGTYSVVATVSGCPSPPATTSATVNPYPIATITGPGTVCPLSTGLTASVPDAGSGALYTWGITGGTITGGAGTREVTWTAGGAGQAVLTVDVSAAGCVSSDNHVVTISSSLDTTITAESSVCSSSTDHAASVTDAGAGATYGWTITGGTIVGSASARTITYTAGSAGTLSLGVTVGSGGCSSQGSQNVQVQDGSAAPVVAPPSPSTITVNQSTCVGGNGATLATLSARFPQQASQLDAFLVLSATATDDCGKVDRLATRLGGADIAPTTLFPAGASTVTFRFGDLSGNVGTATGTVNVRLQGDLDTDGDVDVFDVVTLAAFIVGNVQAGQAPFLAPQSVADADSNGVIDVFDLVLLQGYVVQNVFCLTP